MADGPEGELSAGDPGAPGGPTVDGRAGPRTADEIDRPDISLIVAVLNEVDNIEPFVDRARRALDRERWEIVFIDDGSTDGTRARIEEAERVEARVRHLYRNAPTGTASAQYDGLARARGRFAVVMDGDLQHRPEELPRLLAPLQSGEADLVIGSRYVPGGRFVERPPLRGAISRAGDLLVRLLLPESWSLSDPMSGYFAFRRDLFRDRSLAPVGMKFLFYALVRVPVDRRREVPVEFAPRRRGSSKLLGLRSGIVRALVASARDAARSRPSHRISSPDSRASTGGDER